MDHDDLSPILEAIDEQLEVFTEQSGNTLDGAHVLDHDIVERDILVNLSDGRQFAIVIEAV